MQIIILTSDGLNISSTPGGDPTQSVLKNCASTTDTFFVLTSANQLITTFQQIGTALTNLRIAQQHGRVL